MEQDYSNLDAKYKAQQITLQQMNKRLEDQTNQLSKTIHMNCEKQERLISQEIKSLRNDVEHLMMERDNLFKDNQILS